LKSDKSIIDSAEKQSKLTKKLEKLEKAKANKSQKITNSDGKFPVG